MDHSLRMVVDPQRIEQVFSNPLDPVRVNQYILHGLVCWPLSIATLARMQVEHTHQIETVPPQKQSKAS